MNRDGTFHGHGHPLFEPLEPRLLLDGNVIISEFMAVNDLAWEDPEQETVYPDWIEIHNTEPTTVNLDGWSLEDESHRWYFPDVDLAAGGYLVVIADGADQRDPALQLRTDFSLKSDGEYLALRRPDDSYAWEYAPEYPKQFENISYGIGQDIEVATLVGPHADAAVYVPTADPGWGLAWTAYDYDDSGWTLGGQTGVGYEAMVPGFAVYNHFAKNDINSLSEAESVIATPSKWSSVVSRNDPVINYWGGGNFGGDVPYPGTSFSEDPSLIVTEAFATITIPVAGNYTFGVASDDGFSLQIVGATTTWVDNSTTLAGSDRIDFAALRGTTDTLGIFNFPTAGPYALRLVVFENWGGQSGELFAAPGAHATYDSSFNLVGDTVNGGLYVQSQVVSGGASGGAFEDVIGTDVEGAMRGVNTSAYVRIPFDVADRTAYDSLTLKILYDDGFVAYLNGVKVAERNAPASLAWNSAATADRAKADALVYAEIDVSAYLGDLRDGTNVLAIHGLNYQVSDLEFLVLAQLVDIDILGLGEHYFSTSSPGEPNTIDYYAYVKDTAFDHDRGFYDAAFDLVISTQTPDATIRYTLNGSWPTATTGYVFDPAAPIHIATTTVVRAVAYREGFEPTNVDTQTYVFLSDVLGQPALPTREPGGTETYPDTWGTVAADYEMDPNVVLQYIATIEDDLKAIPTMSLVMDIDDLFGPSGIYSNPTVEDVERPGSLEFFLADGGEEFQVNANVRIYGGVGRDPTVVRHSFRIVFDGTAGGPTKLEFDLFGGSAADQFDSIILRANFNDGWNNMSWGDRSQYMRDEWARRTILDAGGYASHGTYVHLYINGLYWGLYNPVERPDGAFAASYFGGAKEDYDALNSGVPITGDRQFYDEMLRLANTGHTDTGYAYDPSAMASAANYALMQQYVEIPDLIDYCVMNYYAGNWDWDNHNWYAARKREPGGKYRFFAWDTEWINGNLGANEMGHTNDGGPDRIFKQLMANDEFRMLVADHIYRLFFNGGALSVEAASSRYQELADGIYEAIVGESARWGDLLGEPPRTRDGAWMSELNWQLNTYFPQRWGIALQQLRDAGYYVALGGGGEAVCEGPDFNQQGGIVEPGFQVLMSNPNTGGTIYYTLDGSDPRLVGGGISGNAQIYTGPLVIDESRLVRARVLNAGAWSPMHEAVFLMTQPPTLRITEVMYHPQDPVPPGSSYLEEEYEFVELQNVGPDPLNIGGMRLASGVGYTFPDLTLPSGAYVVVVKNLAAFQERYDTVGMTVLGPYTGSLANTGERVRLEGRFGEKILSFEYETDWLAAANGEGFSLTLINPLETDLDAWKSAGSWRLSTYKGGSPGGADPGLPLGSVVINEVLAHQDAPLEDWIELYNTTGADIPIGGWWLSDDAADLQKFQVPAGTVLHAYHYTSFNEAQHFGVGVIPNGFALSEFGEAVYLTAADDVTGELIGYREVQDFGASDRGVTIGRYTSSTGETDFVALAGPTKEGPNSLPLVGPIVINEIMYHPAAGGDEFIELVNVSGDDVPLWLEHADLSISTWRVDGAVEYTFPEGVTLPAGGYLLLVGIDPAEFRAKYAVPAEVQILSPYTGLLDNAGESIKLYKPAEPDPGMEVPYVRVDRVQYDDDPPWPLVADGQGPSLQRLGDTAYGNDPLNWCAGPDEGTPGRLNGATDVTPPRLVAVMTDDGVANKVTVVFSEPVEPATALDAGRYTLDNDVTVTSAAAGANDRTVVLTTTTMSEGPVYHLTVSGVRNLALIETLPGTEVAFTYVDAGSGLKGEYFHWSDVNDMFLESNLALTRTDPGVDFPWGDGGPDPAVGVDRFAVRWTGRVKALYTETYTFYTVTDDGARLWVNGQQLVNDWNWHGDTWNSGTVSLVAGEFYDIRMEMFEDGGGATARLLWSSAHQAQQVISADRLYDTTWPGMGLAKAQDATTIALVFTETMDRDSAQDLANYTVTHAGGQLTLTGAALLPDQRTLWLAAATPMTPGVIYTATVSNVISQSGSSVRDGTESMLIYTAAGTGNVLREYWTGISGEAISLLKADARYPNNPTGRTYESLFESPPGFGDAYGTRMRAYITAPQTGDYTFWIATDDNGELWLSDSEDPAGAVRIAYVPAWVGSRQWYQIAEQQSAPIHLEAGHTYYIEALQKEGGGGDNLAVAWQLPDDTFQGPIPGEYLSPYALAPDKTIGIAATDPDASETGPDKGTFTITRSGNTAAVDVYYTVTGTARTGDMQQYLSGTLHLASGQMSATIDVLPVDDSAIEGPETVCLTLVPDNAYAILMAAGIVTIADNDLVLPTVGIAATDPNAAEKGTDPGEFTVTRTGDLVGALTVYYTLGGTAGAGDYTPALTGQVVIADGSASAVITITPVDDGDQEPDETLILTLSPHASYTVGTGTEATVTILDNELPVVTAVVLNPDPLRTIRTVSQIEPSGIGVDTIRVTFNEAVTFTSANVVAEKVFVDESGNVSVTATLSPTVGGSGTTQMSIQFPSAWQNVIDTWVRIRLTGGVTDGDGHALDGEPRLDSSNLGYIYKATDDLPTGDGTAGGDAVFYVGSLRADMRGFGPFQPNPNGIVDQWDLNGFTSKYTQGNLDADFRGFGPFQPAPNGIVDPWDINGFTSAYTSALTLGKRLWPLPVAPEGMAPGGVLGSGELLSAPLASGDPVAVFAPETSLVAADAAAPLESAPALVSADSQSPAADAESDAADGAYAGVLTVASDEASEPAPAVWSPTASEPSSAGEAVDLLAGPALEVVLSA